MQQISAKRVSNSTWLGGKGDLLEIVQEIGIWPYKQMVYAQSRICPGEWETQTSLGIWDTNGSPNLAQTTKPSDSQQKKKNLPNSGLCYSG